MYIYIYVCMFFFIYIYVYSPNMLPNRWGSYLFLRIGSSHKMPRTWPPAALPATCAPLATLPA